MESTARGWWGSDVSLPQTLLPIDFHSYYIIDGSQRKHRTHKQM